MDSGAPRAVPEPAPEEDRVPLAVAVVDRRGRVSRWSPGARGLFGPSREEAVGRPAADLLPVAGALAGNGLLADEAAYADGGGPDGEGRGARAGGGGPDAAAQEPHPAAGLARLTRPDGERAEVLWWAYPLGGLGRDRLLVLAADVARYRGGADGGPGWAAVPGFAPRTGPGNAGGPVRGLPGILPGVSVREAAGIVARILELGWPVLELGDRTRIPVTPGWGVPRRAGRHSRRRTAGGGAAPGSRPRRRGRDIGPRACVRGGGAGAARRGRRAPDASPGPPRTARQAGAATAPRSGDTAGACRRDPVRVRGFCTPLRGRAPRGSAPSGH
ncbi:PAS domain-containing protein [Streptomyces sp. MRC013]|uniref:PAS domain-containing protein n=1 Tax=Streptomyces sp. MRC013 TaxID=2898276 RepID=UPI0020271C13|nr:PAS domain-containing protein [Streptomyces sp. MRC013]URM89075.1 PAS domain-containing protein [Streptomyces sp. MRC013]